MRNYFLHMNFEDIINDLLHTVRDDATITLKGKQLIVIATMIVAPSAFPYSESLEALTED